MSHRSLIHASLADGLPHTAHELMQAHRVSKAELEDVVAEINVFYPVLIWSDGSEDVCYQKAGGVIEELETEIRVNFLEDKP